VEAIDKKYSGGNSNDDFNRNKERISGESIDERTFQGNDNRIQQRYKHV